jgi:hypothetical protein
MLDEVVEVSYRHCKTAERTGSSDQERIRIAATFIDLLYFDLGWPIGSMKQWVGAALVNQLERGPDIVFQDLRQGGVTGTTPYYRTPSGLVMPATDKLLPELSRA